MEQLDFKKRYKSLYSPSSKEVEIVDVPEMSFLMVDGEGDPNGIDSEFQFAVGALYSVAYTLKFWPKKHSEPKGYVPYTIPPLEGLWAVEGFDGPEAAGAPRKLWKWTAMLAQPEFITEDLFRDAVQELATKKPNPKLASLRLEKFREGESVQILHLGAYADETANILKLDRFMKEHDLKSNGRHHEIYLSDPQRTTPEKLKTILRHPVQ